MVFVILRVSARCNKIIKIQYKSNTDVITIGTAIFN